MNKLNLKKSRLALAMSVLLGSVAATTVMAVEQDAPAAEDDVEVISVKGIRGSYMRASDMKRESSGVVDGISAEEMGKFPDTNLAESLGRITGISISRSNGEGNEITARGFGPAFNLVMLNGRQMPGTGNTRSYDLSNLSPEGVSALEVYKTSRVDKPTGGLGATVNIKTTKPLSSPGQRYSVMAKGMYDSSTEKGDKVTPEVSAIYSNTFMDEMFGVAFTLSHQERNFQQQVAEVAGWVINNDLNEAGTQDPFVHIDHRPEDADGNRIGPAFFPREMSYSFNDVERAKTNGQLTLQWAPSDDLVATVDYSFTDSTTASDGFGWGVWMDGSNFSAYELDETGTAVFVDKPGNDGSFTANRNTTEVKAKSIGLNLEWQATDNLKLSLDYHDSSNESDNGADSGMGSTGQIILGSDQLETKFYDFREGEIPQASILWNNGTTELEPSAIDSNFSQFLSQPGEATVEQLQFDGVWESTFDSPLVSVGFGLAQTEQEMSGHEGWSGLRGGPGFGVRFADILPDAMFTRHDTGSFLDSFEGGGSDLVTNYYYTFNFEDALAIQEANLTEDIIGGDVYAVDAYFDGIDSESSVLEETTSAYVTAAFEFDVFSDMYLGVNAGFRYETTDVTGKVRQRPYQQVNWVSESEWIMVYEDVEDSFTTSQGEHDVWLPSFDLKLDITDDMVARASFGKTLSRSDLGPLAGGEFLSGSPRIGSRTGSEGNSNLQPYVSTNIDLSVEWYYDEGSYASLGYFKKDVKNFIENQQYTKEFDGLHDIWLGDEYATAESQLIAAGNESPTDGDIYGQIKANQGLGVLDPIEPTGDEPLIEWSMSKPINGAERKVDGIELALQHLFGESGFGFSVNATFVDGDVEYDITDFDGGQAILPGISDSANFQAFYEKDGLSVKSTYSWRDSYLVGLGHAQGSTSDQPPTYAKAFGQLDVSINYDVTDQLTVFFDGVNLNDETEQGYARWESQFRYARQYGPRYSLGMRYSFE